MKIASFKKIPEIQNQFYNFWRDGVTQSMIGTWLECPKQCYWQYVKGLEPHAYNDKFLFGNICHYVLQYAYVNEGQLLPGNVITLINEYKDLIQNDYIPMEAYEKNEEIFAKAEGVLLAYFFYYRADWQHKVLFKEYEFRIKHTFWDGKATYLNGMIDNLSFPNKQFTLTDHKCMGRTNIDTILETIDYDLQLNFYLYACWQLKQQGKLKKFPDYFRYNIIRNPQSKRRQNETLDAFALRIQNKVLEDPKHYFYRIKVKADLGVTLNWAKTQLFPILNDMKAWVNSDYNWPSYFNPKALISKGGKLNEMAKVVMSGDLIGYRQKQKPFMELSCGYRDK